MTSNEKAFELVNKYLSIEDSQAKMGGNLMFKSEAKICALITIDEIIQTYHSPMDDEQIQEWQEVRKEVENLPA